MSLNLNSSFKRDGCVEENVMKNACRFGCRQECVGLLLCDCRFVSMSLHVACVYDCSCMCCASLCVSMR